MDLPERLKVARESIGKSQKEIADLVGVSYRAWQGYETGDNIPGGRVFEALVGLGFNGTWLLSGEGEMRRGSADVDDNIEIFNPELLERLIEAYFGLESIYESPKDNALELVKLYKLLSLSYDRKRSTVKNIRTFIDSFLDSPKDATSAVDVASNMIKAMHASGLFGKLHEKCSK